MTEERRLSLETKRKPGYAPLGVMEDCLEGRDFFVADCCSIADIAPMPTPTSPAREGSS